MTRAFPLSLSRLAIFAACLVALTIFRPNAAFADSFADLRAAYAARDANAVAAAYAWDGVVVNSYASEPRTIYRGRLAIETYFAKFFAELDPSSPIDLNYRIVHKKGLERRGVYRLRIGKETYYGRFRLRVAPDGKFARDESFDGTRADFEEARGPVMFAADDEELDPAYYDAFTGRYRLSGGCEIVVTRSILRLFVRNTCTQEWRGLARVSGRKWAAGTRVLPTAPGRNYRFAAPQAGRSARLEVAGLGAALRSESYRLEATSFVSADGTRLAGTLYLPNGNTSPRPATILIHGSGPQTRTGYASIMAVLADQLASQGRVVLIYDKRGVGESTGDWSRARFELLAQDAIGAMRLLAARPEVDPAGIGLAGSSQAGWVAAAAIKLGAKPADVFLLGAAGTALSVAEQNLYNTEVRMRCAKLPEGDIALALEQQRAFFAFLVDPSQAGLLDRLTTQGRARPGLVDWLFPNSRETDRSAGEWYVTLDPAFDPLPIWRDYAGRALLVFAQHDDSTPTMIAAARLKESSAQLRILPGAQHLGLLASDPCRSELGEVSAFSPELFTALAEF
jgi:alpha/beta superfamily hydrolase